MDEDAISEVAKTAGKALDAAQSAGSFLAKFVKAPLEQVAGIAEDWLRVVRWERQLRLMDRIDANLRARGLDTPTRPVSLSFAAGLLQAGSLEENDDLQDRYAALLVNASDAMAGVEARRAFVRILEELAPLDATILDKVYSLPGSQQRYPSHDAIYTAYLPDRVTTERPDPSNQNPPPECEVAIGNLARLGLVLPSSTWGGALVFGLVHPTRLGWEFVRACRPERTVQ